MLQTDNAYALALALVVAFVYLGIVRLLDLNEREPLWGIGALFLFGAIAGGIVNLVFHDHVLELSFWPAAIIKETGIFVAAIAGLGLTCRVSRWRGFSELNGPMDGVVYGSAAGLGFAVGEVFINRVTMQPSLISGFAGPVAVLWTTALSGLCFGMFGAVMGVGLVAARHRVGWSRVGLALASLAGAILVHVIYLWLARGNALSTLGGLGLWLGLLLPILLVVAAIVYSLAQESKAIRDQLVAESQSGAVSDDDLAVLRSFLSRQGLYATTLSRGDFEGFGRQRTLHDMQVQLALSKARLERVKDEGQRSELGGEVERLRTAILAMKQSS